MSKLSDAIKSARKELGLTQAEIAVFTKQSPSNYNSMENGNRPISIKTIKRLASIPNFRLTLDEMLYLKALENNPECENIFNLETEFKPFGEITTPGSDKPSEIGQLYHSLSFPPESQRRLKQLCNSLEITPEQAIELTLKTLHSQIFKTMPHGSKQGIIRDALKKLGLDNHSGGMVYLPRFGSSVPAGFPTVGDEWVEDYLEVPVNYVKHPKDSFVIRAKGDSMLNAGITSGDNLIVDRAIEPKDRDIVVACVDGEFTVKRLRKKRGKLYLEAANENYETLEVTDKLDCCYRVVGCYREM